MKFPIAGPSFFLALTSCLSGCDFVDLRPDRGAPREFGAALERKPLPPASPSDRYRAPPPEVSDALLPDFGASGERRGGGKRFNISVYGADAREFFLGLVADSDYNVIVHPGVRGQIAVDLKNVTLQETLEAVRDVYGYDYKKTAAGYIVYPAEPMSRMYHVDYLNFVRNGRSETRVSSGQNSQVQRGGGFGGQQTVQQQNSSANPMSGGGYFGQGSAGAQPDGDESGAGATDCRSLQAAENPPASRYGATRGLPIMPGSVIATTSNSHFWRELKQALAIVVCDAEGANFVVNQQSGLVIVHAFPKQLREVERFLDAMRREVNRQVVLEAKILEVELKDGYQAGIDWATVIRAGEQATLTSLTGPVAALGAAKSLGGALTLGVNMGDFNAFVELLETQGNVNTLSSPRVSTLNNQKAVIKVGSDEFFVTEITNTIISGNGQNTASTPTIGLTPFFSGIALDVTPQIDDRGEVTLHIHPSVSEVTDREKHITIGGNDQVLPLAFSSVRESDSVVHARNGQIVVIGGLMQNVEKNDRQGVAWLSRLPWLGTLFRRGTGDFRKSELVILLKPTVIETPDDWNGVYGEFDERYRRLDGESRREVLP